MFPIDGSDVSLPTAEVYRVLEQPLFSLEVLSDLVVRACDVIRENVQSDGLSLELCSLLDEVSSLSVNMMTYEDGQVMHGVNDDLCMSVYRLRCSLDVLQCVRIAK